MFDQLKFKSGEIINVYDTGPVVPQGKNQVEVRTEETQVQLAKEMAKQGLRIAVSNL